MVEILFSSISMLKLLIHRDQEEAHFFFFKVRHGCINAFFLTLFIYLFIYGCVGSSFLREGFL